MKTIPRTILATELTVLFFIVATSNLWAAAAEPGPFLFVNPVIRIQPAAQNDVKEITLQSSSPQAMTPKIIDHDLPKQFAATVLFGDPTTDSTLPLNSWRVKVTVSGVNKPNTTQERYAKVLFGEKTQVIPYILTNQPSTAITWKISSMAEPWTATMPTFSFIISNFRKEKWENWPPLCTSFNVTPIDFPATNVTIAYSTLIDKSTKIGIPVGSLSLCRMDEISCESRKRKPINIEAHETATLKLCSNDLHHGNFNGAVGLSSTQKLQGETFLQSAAFSSSAAKLFGFACILAGVLISWWAKVWARARVDRVRALLPVATMRSQLAILQTLLDELDEKYTASAGELAREIKDLFVELSDDRLDLNNYLPPRIPSLSGYTADSSGLKAYIEARNSKVQAYTVLVKYGVVDAANKDNGRLKTQEVELIRDAVREISKKASEKPLPSPESLGDWVRARLRTLHVALFPPPPQPAPAAGVMPDFMTLPPKQEVENYLLEIETINRAAWGVYFLLTALSGYAFLIFNNPGFGVWVDYIFAFFWGFGLPTVVQSLTPTSASSALNVSLPK